MTRTQVLIVDDDPSFANLIVMALKQAGLNTHWVKSSDAAFSYLMKETADLVLLDINLPGISGLKLLELLKTEPRTAGLPIIMMTSESGVDVKVHGLEGGADDYIVKPFASSELLARIKALFRRVRHQGKVDRVREVGGIRIDFDRREVIVKEGKAVLTPIEFRLLDLLSEKPGHVFAFAAIREALGGNQDVSSEALYSHVKNLRKKLGAAGALIETVYGIGYKLQLS